MKLPASAKHIAIALLVSFGAIYIYNKNYFGIKQKLGGS